MVFSVFSGFRNGLNLENQTFFPENVNSFEIVKVVPIMSHFCSYSLVALKFVRPHPPIGPWKFRSKR